MAARKKRRPSFAGARPPKGVLTSTNKFACLAGIYEGGGVVGPSVPAAHLPHFRRCIANGMLVPAEAKGTFRLAEAYMPDYDEHVRRQKENEEHWKRRAEKPLGGLRRRKRRS